MSEQKRKNWHLGSGLGNQLAAYQELLEYERASVGELRSQLNAALEECDTISIRLREIQAHHSELLTECSLAREENSMIAQSLSNEKGLCAELMSQVAQSQVDKSSLIHENEIVTKSLHEMQEELENLFVKNRLQEKLISKLNLIQAKFMKLAASNCR